MFKTIASVLLGLVAAVLLYAATRPDSFRVERAMRIQAPAERIFPLINDLHTWVSWSPYEKLDQAMKRTHSGPASGRGAVYEWEGNSNVGSGRMEITDSAPPSRVVIKLDFIEPFETHNTAEFTLEPAGDATNVTWALYGPNTYLTKLMSLFISMDDMIGKQFDEGLTNLKTVAEQ
jgi:uncharacterized protein YndB with AHSA1/START domain